MDSISTGESLFILVFSAFIALAFSRVFIAFVKSIVMISQSGKFIKSLKINEVNESFIVFESDEMRSFVYGFLKPEIYVSSRMLQSLSKEQIEAVLLHEKGHVRYNHNLKKLFAGFIIEIFPFLPTRESLKSGFNSINEIASDEYCYKRIGSKKPLVSAIQKLFLAKVENRDNLLISNFTIKVSRIDSLVRDQGYQVQHIYMGQLILIIVMLLLGLIIFKPIQVSAANANSNISYGSCDELIEHEMLQSDQLQSSKL